MRRHPLEGDGAQLPSDMPNNPPCLSRYTEACVLLEVRDPECTAETSRRKQRKSRCHHYRWPCPVILVAMACTTGVYGRPWDVQH